MQPDRLVHDLIHAALPDDETDAARTERTSLEALRQFAQLRADLRRDGYPSVDAAKLVRDGRDELEARFEP